MTKKISTSKAKTTPKKTVAAKAKSTKQVKKAPRLTWRFYVVTVGIFLVAVTSVVVLAYLVANMTEKQQNQARLDRINGIYASINVDEDYDIEKVDVFGDKRVYDWDKGRTYSSSVEYLNGDTVTNTVAELDAKIKSAGFTFIDEPYPNGFQKQYHYKSSKGEYIRLSVASKPYFDMVRNTLMMGSDLTDEMRATDKNAGPAKVTLKVNLDDNNE